VGGPRRVHPPGLAFAALPPVHLVLLSHDHYDHGDESTLRRLAAQPAPLFVAPRRPRALLAGCGARRIVKLDWWQSHVIAPAFSVTLTPARHWSNRLGTPRNHRLWGGFSLSLGAPAHRLWFAGDTGYDEELFRSIGHRAGAPDLPLVPIGAYEPRWFMAPMHLNPAEAVRCHQDTGPAAASPCTGAPFNSPTRAATTPSMRSPPPAPPRASPTRRSKEWHQAPLSRSDPRTPCADGRSA
jgi:L-ascorbate metabolism protein UlaG (beta-lactamase superfamily)